MGRSLTLANPGSVVKVLTWLLERQLPADVDPCDRCGHGPYHHRLDDANNISPVDPRAEFRCIWPMPDGPAVELCDCPDYIKPAGREMTERERIDSMTVRLISWPTAPDNLAEHLREDHAVTDKWAEMFLAPLSNTAVWIDWHDAMHEPEGWTGPYQDQPNRPPVLTHMHPATQTTRLGREGS